MQKSVDQRTRTDCLCCRQLARKSPECRDRQLGSNEKIKWNRSAEGLTIQLPKTLPDPLVIAFKLEVKQANRRKGHNDEKRKN